MEEKVPEERLQVILINHEKVVIKKKPVIYNEIIDAKEVLTHEDNLKGLQAYVEKRIKEEHPDLKFEILDDGYLFLAQLDDKFYVEYEIIPKAQKRDYSELPEIMDKYSLLVP